MKNMRAVALSVIGSAHIKNNTVCQDASGVFEDTLYTAAVVSDGHGGEKHFRSDAGSKIALEIFERAIPDFAKAISKSNEPKVKKRLLKDFEKHLILMWREEVSNELIVRPFIYEELATFSDEVRMDIQSNPHIAFGATFLAAIVCNNELFIIQLGDGDCRIQLNEIVYSPIKEDESLKFSRTTSLCDSDAFGHIRDAIIPLDKVSGCMISSDGVKNSFDTEEHFAVCCNTLINEFKSSAVLEFIPELEEFLPKLTAEGSSDDVSVGIIARS